jgi:hypothetical protein
MSPRPRKTTTTRTASKKRATASSKKRGTASKKRATASKTRTTKATSTRQSVLTCPECGRTFTRAAALGAHRRSHGVAGSSANATRTRNTRATSASRGNRLRTNTQAPRVRGAGNSNLRVDRDALLQALFPAGIPAREGTIRRLNAWLNEAEQIAKVG